jgi:hypothetical protein
MSTRVLIQEVQEVQFCTWTAEKYDHRKIKLQNFFRFDGKSEAKGAATPKRQFGTTRPFLSKSDGTGEDR